MKKLLMVAALMFVGCGGVEGTSEEPTAENQSQSQTEEVVSSNPYIGNCQVINGQETERCIFAGNSCRSSLSLNCVTGRAGTPTPACGTTVDFHQCM